MSKQLILRVEGGAVENENSNAEASRQVAEASNRSVASDNQDYGKRKRRLGPIATAALAACAHPYAAFR